MRDPPLLDIEEDTDKMEDRTLKPSSEGIKMKNLAIRKHRHLVVNICSFIIMDN